MIGGMSWMHAGRTGLINRDMLQNCWSNFDTWMRHRCLPFWARNGWDGTRGFAECITFSGDPIAVGYCRARVIARQVAVFSQANMLGLGDYVEIAEEGWNFLFSKAWQLNTGWASRLTETGEVMDPTPNLYDQAFCLYALACRLEWRPELRGSLVELAVACLEIIDQNFAVSGTLGWVSAAGGGKRDQNSHMHLLEALLRLRRSFCDSMVDAKIEEIIGVLTGYLTKSGHPPVFEHFEADWRLTSQHILEFEPGHQFEWYTLLCEAELAGFPKLEIKSKLFQFALQHGFDSREGLFVELCRENGEISFPSYRLWGQCEAIKALAKFPKNSVQSQLMASLIARVFTTFINNQQSGLWVDRFDGQMNAKVDVVPASSLYHLFEAWRSVRSSDSIMAGAR